MIRIQPLEILMEFGTGQLVIGVVEWPREPGCYGLEFYEVPPGKIGRSGDPGKPLPMAKPGRVVLKFHSAESLAVLVEQVGKLSKRMIEAVPRHEPEGEK